MSDTLPLLCVVAITIVFIKDMVKGLVTMPKSYIGLIYVLYNSTSFGHVDL
jgi:hypothetical protein